MNFKFFCLIVAICICLSSCASQKPADSLSKINGNKPFSPYTEDLSKLLETDAASVLVRNYTFKVSNDLCSRLNNSVSKGFDHEYSEWEKRNSDYIKKSVQALNDIGNRYVPTEGEKGMQAYYGGIMVKSSQVAGERIASWFGGSDINNDILPPVITCMQLINVMRDGRADYINNPELTRALIIYMQKNK